MSTRQSPFVRVNSTASRSPTPTSPLKSSNLSPTKSNSLSPEKASLFVRRPSQIGQSTERPSSPFARPSSSLSISTSPAGEISTASKQEETLPASPKASDVISRATTRLDSPSYSPSPFDGASVEPISPRIPSQAALRSTATSRDRSSSNTSTIKAPSFTSALKSTTPRFNQSASGYSHVPQPLLRSMRESFEVLDSSNSGAITSSSVASMLEQMGFPSTPADVRAYFPSSGPTQLNLARYLDTLSGPMADLSQADELAAAFSAFDVDDSGQVDVMELRNALLNTAPEPGEHMIMLSEREVDGILGEFAGRRAFGTKGTTVVKSKGDVFRWRDFMGSVNGGVGSSDELAAA